MTGRNAVCAAVLAMVGLGLPAVVCSAPWTDPRLDAFLREGRRAEAVLPVEVLLIQDQQTLPWYRQTGREERREKKQRRPILEPGSPDVFTRGDRLVARVDRSRPLHLRTRFELVRPGSEPRSVSRTPVERIRLRLLPAWKHGEFRELRNGILELSLNTHERVSTIRIQVVTKTERHTLDLDLLDRRRPVTVEGSTKGKEREQNGSPE